MEIIAALDFQNADKAKDTVKSIGSCINYYKVGLELFVAAGPSLIDWLKSENKKVFLDLKFHDIPNTASRAVIAASEYGVDMINIHTQGGIDMMKACVNSLDEFCGKKGVNRPLLIGVTLLTSLDNGYLQDFGIETESSDYVLKLAKYAKSAGLDGIVSSAKETKLIKDALGSEFITVTPGIRPAGADAGDQKRIVTPKDALELGSDYAVIGRPITAAENPSQAAKLILKEISNADIQ
ncbi:MAG: orotidine-5'-phosphate decarboxylase [Mucispirillum sp.]|nr:orotidine-5'-phosphate decarboxylase [Mucispirillum sp.]